jgi:hypothetical protein
LCSSSSVPPWHRRRSQPQYEWVVDFSPYWAVVVRDVASGQVAHQPRLKAIEADQDKSDSGAQPNICLHPGGADLAWVGAADWMGDMRASELPSVGTSTEDGKM